MWRLGISPLIFRARIDDPRLRPGQAWDAASWGGGLAMAGYSVAGCPVIHVRHEFPATPAPFFEAGTEGAEIHPAVAPVESEPVILKQFPNAFRETDLAGRLDAIGPEEVVFVGAMSHMCVDATVRAAADGRYAATVVHDACASRDVTFGGVTTPAAQVHAAYMASLEFAYAKLDTTDAIAAGWPGASVRRGFSPSGIRTSRWRRATLGRRPRRAGVRRGK